MNENKSNKPASYWFGRVCGTVVVGCLAICVMAIAVALTYKFILWLI